MSYLEIYNEHTRDLLNGNNEDTTYADLLIVEDPKKGHNCPRPTEYEINYSERIVIINAKRKSVSNNGSDKSKSIFF